MTDAYIIAYRNPIEAWMWESGAIWPILAVLVVFTLGWMGFISRRVRQIRNRRTWR